MLKFLTQKLKNQSLTEVCPLSGNENLKQSSNIVQKCITAAAIDQSEDGENCDTKKSAALEEESDEENAEICSITKGLEPAEKIGRQSSCEQQQTFQTPTISPSVNRTPFRQMNLNNFVNHEGRDSAKFQDIRRNNSQANMDNASGNHHVIKYTNLQVQSEDNSSEEELASINFHDTFPEKRKWSQVSSHNAQLDSPGTSDEEVRELVKQPKPSKFSCSPPRGVPKLQKTVSPKLFLANVSPVCESCWISPRKRQRQSSEVSPIVIQRPCLDLEKMQKTNVRKHLTHSNSKARLVKIKTFNSMGKSARCMVDPELFTFRSISTYNQLTPVEEPCAH